MVPCAYLRAFEPLDALPRADRDRWRRYVAAGEGITRRGAIETESRVAATRLLTGRPPIPVDGALVRRSESRTYVCPLELPERHAVALLAFRETLPTPVAEAVVPSDEARAAVRAIRRLGRPPHTQESSWAVPLRWFAAFAPDDRHVAPAVDGTGGRIVYLTIARAAVQRIERASAVVDAHVEGGDEIVEALNDLGDWLGSFDKRSLIELDYGGITTLIDVDDLVLDTSCADVWEAIDQLERGDLLAAARAYGIVSARWARLQLKHQAS